MRDEQSVEKFPITQEMLKGSILNAFNFITDEDPASVRMVLDKTRSVDSIKTHRFNLIKRYKNEKETTWGSNLINKSINDVRSGISQEFKINFLSASCFQIAIRYYSANKAFYIDEAFQTNSLKQSGYSQLVDELIRSYKIELEYIALSSLYEKAVQVLDGDSYSFNYHSLADNFYKTDELNDRYFVGPFGDGKFYNLLSYSIEDVWKFIIDKSYQLKSQYKSSDVSLILPDSFATDSSYLLSSQFSPIKLNDNSIIAPSLDNGSSSFINFYTTSFMPVLKTKDVIISENVLDQDDVKKNLCASLAFLFVKDTVDVISSPLLIKKASETFSPSALVLHGEFRCGASRVAKDSVYAFIVRNTRHGYNDSSLGEQFYYKSLTNHADINYEFYSTVKTIVSK